MSLFLQVKAGKVVGPEMTPFVLPNRWTFETLKNCVEDYVQRKTNEHRRVKQLYYKRSRGKSVERLDGDSDISALLDEYPLRYPSGKKRERHTMYLAVDLDDKGKPKYILYFLHLHNFSRVYCCIGTLISLSSFVVVTCGPRKVNFSC